MTAQPLLGQHVVFTGETTLISRANARQIVQDAGGDVMGNVTPETTMLVVSGPSHVSQRKIVAAETHGARIMSEAQFVALLNEG